MTTQITCSKPLFGIILFLSLTANVFLGGVMLGKHMYGAGDMGGGGFGLHKVMKAFRSLSDESRDKASASVKKNWPEVQKHLEAVKDKRKVVRELLLQPEYKDEDLDKAMAEVRTEVNALIDAGQALGKDVMKSVTPEERQKLIRMWRNPPAE